MLLALHLALALRFGNTARQKDPVKRNLTETSTNTDSPIIDVYLSDGSSFQFKKGQEISIFPTTINSYNYPETPQDEQSATFNGEKFQWKAPQTAPMRVVAYYPKYISNDNVFTQNGRKYREIQLVENQNSKQLFEQAQMYVAKTDTQSGGLLGELSFYSVFTEIEVELAGDSFTDEELSSATVQVRSQSRANVDLTTGQVNVVFSSEKKWATAYHKGGTKFSALIIPQPVYGYYTKPFISVNIKGKTVIFPAPSSIQGKDYENTQPGEVVHLKLNVHIEDFSAYKNQKKFVYNITEPREEDWVLSDWGDPKFLSVFWKEGCGWFDIKKRLNNNDPDGKDFNLCVPATASNLLHWWLSHNQDYVKRIESFKTAPQKFIDILTSEIFNFFKHQYGDHAGVSIVNAIQHYITGLHGDNTGEFLKEVFGDKAPVDVKHFYFGVNNKDKFNRFVIDALENKRAIGMDTPVHATNLWGVEFDDEGYISYLYYTDNNDRNTDVTRTPGLKKNRVQYRDERIWFEDPMYRYTNNGYIQSLTTIDLATEKWEEYFKNK